MAIERIVVPPKDYVIFQRLQAEVGKLENPEIIEAENAGLWYNEDLVDAEMAVRGVMRDATLERLGYQYEEDWIVDEEDIARSLDSKPDIKEVLGDPDFMHYKWQRVSATDMGRFVDLNIDTSMPIVDIQRGIVLFSDEVRQLAEGRAVTTLHSSGFEDGFLAESKEVFKVVNGNLQRIRAFLTD